MRRLTDKEIEYVLSGLFENRLIPKKVSDSILSNNKRSLKNQLEKIEIYPDLIDDFKKEIETEYIKSMIEPGESVGIVAAQPRNRPTSATQKSFSRVVIDPEFMMFAAMMNSGTARITKLS